MDSYALWMSVRLRRGLATSALLGAVGGSIWRLSRSAFQFYVARRELTKLAALSDRELRDIGLGAYDIASVANAPMKEDPTKLLHKIAYERRKAARQQAREAFGSWAWPSTAPSPQSTEATPSDTGARDNVLSGRRQPPSD